MHESGVRRLWRGSTDETAGRVDQREGNERIARAANRHRIADGDTEIVGVGRHDERLLREVLARRVNRDQAAVARDLLVERLQGRAQRLRFGTEVGQRDAQRLRLPRVVGQRETSRFGGDEQAVIGFCGVCGRPVLPFRCQRGIDGGQRVDQAGALLLRGRARFVAVYS